MGFCGNRKMGGAGISLFFFPQGADLPGCASPSTTAFSNLPTTLLAAVPSSPVFSVYISNTTPTTANTAPVLSASLGLLCCLYSAVLPFPPVFLFSRPPATTV